MSRAKTNINLTVGYVTSNDARTMLVDIMDAERTRIVVKGERGDKYTFSVPSLPQDIAEAIVSSK